MRSASPPTSEPESHHDVIVMGGGPAGSASAALLARYGYDVLLLEKERFPREHVGESMLPFCYRLFEDLGVLDEMVARFPRKPGVRFIDRHGHTSTTWCFGHILKDETYLSFQVLRGEFDQVLLKNAERLGAKVCEEMRVRNADIFSAPDSVAVTATDSGGQEHTYRARFLIDATGRDALVASKNGWRKPREELDRTALWSHWANVKLAGGLEEGLSLIIYLGEEKKGWIWVFPMGTERITAGAVMQNSYMRSERQKLQANGSTDWMYDLCMQELRLSPLVNQLLEGSRMVLPMLVNGDYSYEVKNHFGSNYALVGDARGFIDPIFSSGVFLCLKSAYLVTAALHEQLQRPVEGVHPQLVTAYDHITGAYEFVHRMIRLFYNPHAITWAEVGAEGQAHRQHESALAAGHYMLSGDFFENYEKYNRYFEILENPNTFKLYKKTIIDRKAYNEPSCFSRWDEVFADMEEWDRRRIADYMQYDPAPPAPAASAA